MAAGPRGQDTHVSSAGVSPSTVYGTAGDCSSRSTRGEDETMRVQPKLACNLSSRGLALPPLPPFVASRAM